MPNGLRPCFCPVPNGIEDRGGIFHFRVDLPAEFAGEGDPHELAIAAGVCAV